MSACLRQRVFHVKIEQKLRVFWGCDFEGILEGFWEGLGEQNLRFSLIFRCFFEVNFEAPFGR